MKENTLANELTLLAMRQLSTSWTFKLPRVRTISKYRKLENGYIEPRLRSQFNVPIPIFAGMIDTLQADLNDRLILKYDNPDPADWKAVKKVNAFVGQNAGSARDGAQWDKKFRQFRHEMILAGRGILEFTSSKEGGYANRLSVIPFEDFYFEPYGGGNLENHLFCGKQGVYKSKFDLEQGVKDGIYDSAQVKKLIGEGGGTDVKMAGMWDSTLDVANRFRPLGLNPESNNFVGSTVFHLVDWVLEHKGSRWYILFDPYSGIWVRFEKWADIDSSELFPWMSAASHEDIKNFASKSFADDLYPVADAAITLFNQELTNRQKRNLNAKAYDKQMFKDLSKLDEAQYRPDALVPVDTLNGTRRISEGVFQFETPTLTGTIDLIAWLQQDTGKNLGVTDIQQGQAQAASKKVGIAFMEQAQISKRLGYMSDPFLEVGQQLGLRFFASLKDNMTQPQAIKLLGENGIEMDVLKRVDLNIKKDFEITISSEVVGQQKTAMGKERKIKALEMTAGSPNVNSKVRDEYIFRDVGEFTEYEIALLLDTSTESDKETQAEVSAAIQEIVLRKKMPQLNWNADRFFLKRINEFARKHKDTLDDKTFTMLMQYGQMHEQIIIENTEKQAAEDAKMEIQQQMTAMSPAMPANEPIKPVNPSFAPSKGVIPA